MPAVTLAHLSDVHLDPICGFTPGYWNLKRALGYINWQRGRKFDHLRMISDKLVADIRTQGADHIVVSGDLTNLGLPAEFEAARAWLNALGPPDFVSVVPGNHDIYTKRTFGASCLKDWAPYMESDAWGRSHISNLTAQFPYVRRIGPVALVGLNSAVPTPPFVAAGLLGDDQIERLKNVLIELKSESLIRVVVIHHPPLPGQAPKLKELDDSPKLKAVLEQYGAELVLHGHNHTDTLITLVTKTGPCVISGVPSGSSALTGHPHRPLARYQLYKIADGGTIERISRGLATIDGEVVELSRQHVPPAVLT